MLATNTSSLSITEMAADLEHPERVVGFHFFNPVAVMPLLEIVRGERTDDATLATAFATGKDAEEDDASWSRTRPSFIVNRLLGRFMGEVGADRRRGHPGARSPTAPFAGLAPMPPFVLLGLVGPAIALHNSETLHAGLPATGSTSRRTCAGSSRPASAATTSGPTAARCSTPRSRRCSRSRPTRSCSTVEQVRERVLGVLAEEARLMLDEGVVAGPEDLDLAMITGAGFSFWNGGLTPLLDREGVSERVTGGGSCPPGWPASPPERSTAPGPAPPGSGGAGLVSRRPGARP